jgi:ribosomal protein S18 acetylase RimI-like enzyme
VITQENHNLSPSFRLADIKDIDTLKLIEETCFDTYRLSPRQIRYHIKRPQNLFIVANCGDVIAGSGLILIDQKHARARIYSLAVLPKFRGLKIGVALVQRMEQLAKQNFGIKKITLEAKLEDINVNHFYRSLGFHPRKIIADYYGPGRDATYFVKEI